MQSSAEESRSTNPLFLFNILIFRSAFSISLIGRTGLNDETATQSLEKTILEITAQKKPETVNQLVELVRQAYPASDKETLDAIIRLQNSGRLQLTAPAPQRPGTSAYLMTSAAAWFWATLALTFGTLIAVFTIPENDFPLVYIRYALGITFILWLPGYAFIKALFPQHPPITKSNELDGVVYTALSVGMSLALVPIVGLLLNYTPWGIQLTPIVLSLLALTVIFATVGVLREQQLRTPRTTQTR